MNPVAVFKIEQLPPDKTFDPIGVDEFGRLYGWLNPGELDPYSEPYLIAIEDDI